MDETDIPASVMDTNPTIHPSVFIARGAQIVGDVRLGEGSSIWYNAVLRGDINYIEVGRQSRLVYFLLLRLFIIRFSAWFGGRDCELLGL